jgi:CBS domain-containing protein
MGTASGGHGTLIRDVMSTRVHLIKDSDTAQHAAGVMAREDVGALPVTDARGSRLTGFLTDRDIAVRLVAAGACLACR